MDLANIIIISFILFLIILVPPLVKRAYHTRRCKKLLIAYKNSYEQHNNAVSKESVSISDNVIDLEEYRERKYNDI